MISTSQTDGFYNQFSIDRMEDFDGSEESMRIPHQIFKSRSEFTINS
jgi:predicted Abi (CAAX) family protease